MTLFQYEKPTSIANTQLFINGQFVNGVDNSKIDIINPSDESQICQVQEAKQKDVNLAIEIAGNSFLTWKQTHSKDRCRILNKIADDIEENMKEYVEIESLNTGRPISQSEIEIQQIVEIFRFYAGSAEKLTGQTFNYSQNQLVYTKIQPYGVVGIISSWSSQFLGSVKVIAPALAAGNTIVHKPSEVTPLSLLRFCYTLQKIQLQQGVYNLCVGYGPTAGKALASNLKVKLLQYQGSQESGNLVLECRKHNSLKTRIEINGKGSIIIGSDVDVVGCANLAWACAMYNMGQNNVQGSKILIHEQIYDKFIANLKTASQSNVSIGDPFKGANHGPFVNQLQEQKYLALIDQIINNNKGKLFSGGKKPECNGKGAGYFAQPTILIDTQDQLDLDEQSVMGPILMILKPWKNLDEVIQRTNNFNYGQSTIIMSQDQGTIQKCISEIDTGNVYVNCWMNPQVNVPYTLQKMSGCDVQGGEDIIYEYTRKKAVYHHVEQPKTY